MSDDRTVRAADPRGRPLALFATTFERDEPTAAIATAAQLLPDVDILLPGDVKRLDRRLLAELRALPNVTLPGWLDRASYLTRLGHASVAVALTTDTHSVMRGACEAVWLGVPTVLTDNVLNREYFAPSTFTLHSGDAIAAAVRLALSCDADAAATDAADRKRKLAARWKRQRAELLRAIEPQHSL
jgi:glycosyltransferase involved in cell wall biosynthesis